ncbi:MAG: hypothetical protein JO257_04605 [Deltaproteobacteria bacterium]|nr:hypothetical protein [Deltaproteobacteria bacterium]
MPDFREFLGTSQTLVLPYFGGTRVDAADRRWRIEGDLAPGWWRFRTERRSAIATDPARPEGLASLPRVRGHWVDGWIATDGRLVARIALPPDDEPAPFSRASARRWYSGDLVLDSLDFEDEPELAARRALEERRPLGDVKGVVPSLRLAFGIALGGMLARSSGIVASVRELVPRAIDIAEYGGDAVTTWFRELEVERERAAAEARQRAEQLRIETAAGSAREMPRRRDPVVAADDALDHAGARMLSCQRIERGAMLDVTYEVDGVRIISRVHAETLKVLDPGVCLAGEHGVLTLDAMPSVIREAIEESHLNITRRA